MVPPQARMLIDLFLVIAAVGVWLYECSLK